MNLPRLFHGRSIGPLLGPWIACIVVAAVVFFFEKKMPAFHDVVQPVYWILATILVIATTRAFRTRAGKRRSAERRHGDRRHRDG
jgi:hypothetical protein